MKRFKNKLAVKGSKSLLKAFEEELVSLGYEVYNPVYYKGDLIVNNWGDKINILSYAPDDHSRIQKADYKLTLPQNWDLALKLAAEVEEEIPEYVESLCNIDKEFTKGKIYQVNKGISNEVMYSVFKDDVGDQNGMGKGNFKPSTKEAFEEQNKPKFKEGDWLYNNEGDYEALIRFNGINNTSAVITNEYYNFGRGILIGEGKSNSFIYIEDVRLATDEEIKRILTKVAEIKYPIGTRIKPRNLGMMSGSPKNVKITLDNFHFSLGDYQMWVKTEQWNSIIYKDGKWAEIVKEPKLIVNDYEVIKINDYTVKIGCQTFQKDSIEVMMRLLNGYGGTYVFKDNTKWTATDLDKILSVFD